MNLMKHLLCSGSYNVCYEKCTYCVWRGCT